VKAGRKNGPDVWQFRLSEKGGDGKRVYRKQLVATIEQYSDAAAAQQLAAIIIAKPSSLVAELCELFPHRELLRMMRGAVIRQQETTSSI
jgi:hypothetical protein